jgi:hypothetical protein
LGVLFDWHPPRYIPPTQPSSSLKEEKTNKKKREKQKETLMAHHPSQFMILLLLLLSLSRLCWDVYSNYLVLVWVQKKKVRSYSID